MCVYVCVWTSQTNIQVMLNVSCRLAYTWPVLCKHCARQMVSFIVQNGNSCKRYQYYGDGFSFITKTCRLFEWGLTPESFYGSKESCPQLPLLFTVVGITEHFENGMDLVLVSCSRRCKWLRYTTQVLTL